MYLRAEECSLQEDRPKMGVLRGRLGVFLFLPFFPIQVRGGTNPLPKNPPPAPETVPWEAPAPRISPPELRPIVIDPGHGGEDWGAMSAGREEKFITLSVARKLRDRLQALGLGPVRMTRDSDDYVPLNGRVDDNSAWDGALFISLHANKVFRRGPHGVVVYAFGKGHGRSDRHHRHHRKVPPLPPPPQEQVRASSALAASLVRGLRHEGFFVEAPERAEYYVLKNPRTPSVLVEMGYLSNPAEAKLLVDPSYQDRLASALAESLAEHLARHAPERLRGAAQAPLQAKADSVGR
jgi:N-acetylmuramoyl-L-alanine amidase